MTHETSRSLTTVHQALSEAALIEHSGASEFAPTTIRIEPDLKGATMAICERHGTNLSEFLRSCCRGLLRDYIDPSVG